MAYVNKERSSRDRSSGDSPRYVKKGFGSDRPPRRDRPRRDSNDRRESSGSRYSKDSSYGRRRDEKPTMHKVVCDKCHKRCEVPFLPTDTKPVYCRDCFKGPSSSKESGNNNNNNNNIGSQIKEINEKLDRIIRSLGL